MSLENVCPKCEQDLDWQGGAYHCKECEVSFSKVAYCPTCDALLEKLQACGSVSYFCNSCNEMKSKSAIRVEFQPAS